MAPLLSLSRSLSPINRVQIHRFTARLFARMSDARQRVWTNSTNFQYSKQKKICLTKNTKLNFHHMVFRVSLSVFAVASVVQPVDVDIQNRRILF